MRHSDYHKLQNTGMPIWVNKLQLSAIEAINDSRKFYLKIHLPSSDLGVLAAYDNEADRDADIAAITGDV